MNEELIDKMFEDAVANGYSKDRNAFVNLLNSDTEVFSDMYIKFGQGQMNQDQFRSVITPKKKESSQVGSQKTQPTSGSKPAPSSNKPFAGSIDYLDQAPKFGEVSGLPKVPGTEGVVPDQKKVEQKPQQQQQPKRTIVRGEEADQAIAESLSPQAPVAESTQPVKPVAPMTVEEGQLQKVIEKEKSKPAEFINYQDIDKLYSDPENSTKDYFSMFLDNAKKSEKGDVEYGKNLRDAYAAEFIDEEFENEYRLSSEIDNIDRKMRTELASLSEKAKTDPNAANLLQTKTNEYLSIINKKQKDLDSAREQNNQRFKNRIAEIDNLFKTGEAALREDSLLAEKNELVRKMNLIELAKNPNKLKDSVSKMEYDNIPGATAQDKLTNYLNSRLTAYDLFYNADKEADSLPQEMRGNIKDSYSKLKSELKDLYYLTSLRRYQNAEDRPGFFEATGEAFSREFLDGGIDFSDSPQIHSENLQAIAKNAGIEFSDKDKSYIEITSAPADPYSGEWWGDMFGNTLAFGGNIAVTAPIGSGVLKVGQGIIKSAPKLKKLAEYGLKRYSKLSSTGQKITNGVFNSLDEGYNFEMANQLIYDGESDELTFLTGIGGAVMAAPVNKLLSKTGKLLFGKSDEVIEAVAGKAYTKEEAAALEALGAQTDDVRNFLSGVTKENGADDYVYMLQGTFGNKAPEAIKQIQKVGAVLIARPTGETAQEMGEELTSIYKQSDSFEAFQKEFSKRFPDADAATQFVVASYVMGLGFGLGNYVGDVFSAQSKKSFDQLSPEQQAIATEAIRQATEDVNNADAEAINEIELDEASRPKSKEEEEWSAKEAEIKQGIDNNTKRVNELDGLRNEIYSAYNITDPKTEDISVLSETDAVKLELLNKEIKKAQEAKIKDEIEMEIHNKNKPVVDQTPVNAIHAKDLETKKETDAVQEPSTEEVLPRQQGATTETGGQPQGMGQIVQGEKATQQGQEVSQENIEANIANIEKRRQEELDNYTEEELNEVYAVGSTDTVGDRINARYDLEVDKANETQKQATTQEGQKVNQKDIEAKKSDIERRRQEELKEYENRNPAQFFKQNTEGNNTETTEEQNEEIEQIIQAAIDNGNVTAEKLWKMISRAGYTYSSYGSSTATLAYLKNRLNGITTVKPGERLTDKTNAKYDAELAALEGKQEVSQEGATLNKEPFAEDVTPEQKAKVEEQNKKDEEEAVTEIYDFNDEIKSIGTKEQFKAFLKTLVPEGVFSRIAWHNTSKPELTPREKQYYTNTRKNAEDTYKQENTFPAIIFGNNPKKATFDEVQDVDTEAVKGSGNDIVITDDLSPSIGADMNYREFVTTNSDQVIPLATKENIDAFKAFVEQQKETPTETVQAQEVEQEVAPEEEVKAQEESDIDPGDVTPELEENATDNYDFSQESRPEVQDAVEFAKDPEETVNKVIDDQVTEQEQEEIAKELGISKVKVKERIASEVNKILSGSKDFIENSKSKFSKAVSKVVKYMRKGLIALAIAASTGVSFAGIELASTGYANNAIELAISPLPSNVQETAVRGLVKLGLYDVNKNEEVVDNEGLQDAPTVSINPEDVKYKAQNTFTQVVGKVKDNHAKAVKGSELIMIRNQFFNDNGFDYIPGSIKSRSKSGDKYENVIGVAHFMILDDQGVDLTNKTSDKELEMQSSLFKKQRIGRDIKSTDFVPVFKKNSDGSVNLKYKKASEVSKNDITITKLNQYKLSEIDFDSKADGRNFGFMSGTVFGLKTKSGKDVPSLLFTTAGKDAYSRFSGGSAVFIFNDNKGNLIVRDFSGSINMIKKEGENIAKQYGLSPNDITIGFFDAGSYTGKPAAKKGVVVYDQYSGYNTLHPNSGGALIIPSEGNKSLKENAVSKEDVSANMSEEFSKASNEFAQIKEMKGLDKLDAMREFKEKYGEIGERIANIDSNFDNILDKLGAIKTCTIEIIRT